MWIRMIKLFLAFTAIVLTLTFHHSRAQRDDKKLAQDVLKIFEKSCGSCHGSVGKFKEILLLERQSMLDKKQLVPGKPQESKVYLEVLSNGTMPLSGSKLPTAEVNLIRDWIAAGAPDWRETNVDGSTLTKRRSPISTEAMIRAIERDLEGLDSSARPFTRYFTITHLHNQNKPDSDLQVYRAALAKLINSLSWEADVINPVPVDTESTILRIDLRNYQWDQAIWQTILSAYPYGVQYNGYNFSRLVQLTGTKLPFIRADWFIAKSALPPLYHDILQLPKTERELESRLGVNVENNVKTAAGVRVMRAGFNKSGVSVNNRIVERHRSSYGAYWKSHDFANNVGRQNIFQHPLDFQRAGGEIIFNLPNGLQAYLIVDAAGKRIDKAPTDIVSDNTSRNVEVRNGLSCMACHVQGMKDNFTDEVRQAVMNSNLSGYDRDLLLQLYPEPSLLSALIERDKRRFEDAIKKTGNQVGTREPILELVSGYDESLSLARAAAETGLDENEFRTRLSQSPPLLGRGLNSLLPPGGIAKRDAWESNFGQVVHNLLLSTYLQPGYQAYAQPSATGVPVANGCSSPGTLSPDRAPNGMEFVCIPAGEFSMGSNFGEADEKPVHPVTISRSFELGKFEVTQAQWEAITRSNRSQFKGPNLPVETVSWDDVQGFIEMLNQRDSKYVYRLPTEAEWEYAARAGSKGEYAGVLDSMAWYDGNSGGTTHSVGQKQPNAWGLYDMHGNVWEWVQDWYDSSYYSGSPTTDPRGPSSGSFRVFRGGGWNGPAAHCRSANRLNNSPGDRHNDLGFRLLRTPK